MRPELPDAMGVLLTVAQNRFLLDSLRGEGFLDMRLSDQEAQQAVGIDPSRQVFTACIQSAPCVLERPPDGGFMCETHHLVPARAARGIRAVDPGPGGAAAVRRPGRAAEGGDRLPPGHGAAAPGSAPSCTPTTRATPGTFAFLLGDAGNAIHFSPGRGLNSGLASAISLAR